MMSPHIIEMDFWKLKHLKQSFLLSYVLQDNVGTEMKRFVSQIHKERHVWHRKQDIRQKC